MCTFKLNLWTKIVCVLIYNAQTYVWLERFICLSHIKNCNIVVVVRCCLSYLLIVWCCVHISDFCFLVLNALQFVMSGTLMVCLLQYGFCLLMKLIGLPIVSLTSTFFLRIFLRWKQTVWTYAVLGYKTIKYTYLSLNPVKMTANFCTDNIVFQMKETLYLKP